MRYRSVFAETLSMFVSEVPICLGSRPRNAPTRLRGDRGRLRERADLRGRFREGWAAGSG